MERQDPSSQQENRVTPVPPWAVRPDPGIDLNMQNLSIHDPEVVHIQVGQKREEQG